LQGAANLKLMGMCSKSPTLNPIVYSTVISTVQLTYIPNSQIQEDICCFFLEKIQRSVSNYLTSPWLRQFVYVAVQHQQSSSESRLRPTHFSCLWGIHRNTDAPQPSDYSVKYYTRLLHL